MNKYIATGNLVRDVEMTYSKAGLAIFRNCLAVKDGFKKDVTYFHNFTAFGKTAETMANHLQKGSKILIEGQLTTSNYEKDGQKRTSTDIILDRFEFLDSKKDASDGGSQAPQGRGQSYGNNQPQAQKDPFLASGESIDISNDDLPF